MRRSELASGDAADDKHNQALALQVQNSNVRPAPGIAGASAVLTCDPLDRHCLEAARPLLRGQLTSVQMAMRNVPNAAQAYPVTALDVCPWCLTPCLQPSAEHGQTLEKERELTLAAVLSSLPSMEPEPPAADLVHPAFVLGPRTDTPLPPKLPPAHSAGHSFAA